MSARAPARGVDLAAHLADPEAIALLRASLRFGPIEFRAAGVSMRPLLRSGDTVRVEQRPPVRGDVALAVCGDRLVLHRIVRQRARRWLLRGDARRGPDGWIDAAEVLGVVTARRVRRGERDAWRRLDRPLDRALGLALAAVAAPLRRLRRRIRPARASRGARPAAARRAAARPPAGSRVH